MEAQCKAGRPLLRKSPWRLHFNRRCKSAPPCLWRQLICIADLSGGSMAKGEDVEDKWRDSPPRYEIVPLGWIKLAKRNSRKHAEAQIDEIAESITASGTINPLIVDENYQLIAGEGRYRALAKLKAKTAPVLCIRHLSDEQKRVYAITDNRLAEKSSWDVDKLTLELRDLQLEAPQIDLTVTGFGHAQIEQMVTSLDQTSWSDLDQTAEEKSGAPAINRVGDIWLFEGGHSLACGDSTDRQLIWLLMGQMRARIVTTDPPFNRPDKSYSGKGRHKHGNFGMGFGELSSRGFVDFLGNGMAAIKPHLADGALLYEFMDWQHLHELLQAGAEQELALKNILVWDKGKGGMGSLYRSGHELICLFKYGDGPHTNNIMLGKNGRDRSNVLRYAGMNSFGGGRDKALAMHATVKPVQLIADLLLDASNRGDIVFDGFGGSGTTLIAAHKMERQARLVELSPAYCDTIIERFIRAFGSEPVLAESGLAYSQVRESRGDIAGEHGHGE